jgi:hypothetical protein
VSNFRTCHPFQFTVFDSLRQFELLYSVKLQIRRVSSSSLNSLRSITSQVIRDAAHLKNSGSYVPEDHPAKPLMSAIRLVGSKTKYEILSTIISSAPPALYVTLDHRHILAYKFANKTQSLDHRHILAYKFANKTQSLDLANLPRSLSEDEFRLRQAAQNPVGLAEFFQVLINQILKTLFGGGQNNAGIFGRMEHYYGMVEAQNRGTLHIHLVLWIQGTPNADTLYERLNTDNDFKTALFAYLDGIIKTDTFRWTPLHPLFLIAFLVSHCCPLTTWNSL